MIDVRDGVFSRLRSNYYLGFLDLTPLADDIIPENFLGFSVERLDWFYLRCENVNGLLEVNPSAFENNITTTEFNNLVTYNCNFANLSFLSGMRHLDQLYFENSSNLCDVCFYFSLTFYFGLRGSTLPTYRIPSRLKPCKHECTTHPPGSINQFNIVEPN